MRADNLIIEKINQTFYKNLTKMAVSLIFMLIINSLIGGIVMGTTMILMQPSTALLLLWLVVLVSLFLYYGFSVILGNFYQEKPTIIGDLFIGKKDNRRLIFITLIIMGIFVAVIFIFLFFLLFYGLKKYDLNTESGLNSLQELGFNSMLFAVGGVFLFMFILALPHALLFPTMANNPKLKLKEVLRESRQLLKGRFFKFIWFCIKAGKYPLITAILSLGLSFAIPNEFVVSILDFVFTISFYYLVIYVILSINAYYYELTAKDDEFLGIEEDSGTLENQEMLENQENLEKTENSSEEEECLSLPEA